MKRVFGIAVCLSLVLALTGCGRAVPDFRGMTVGAAEKAIAAAGLKVGDVSYSVDAGGATGTVVAQNPDVGARVGDGTIVALTLAGAEPVAAPSLAGLDASATASALAAAGLKVGTVVESYSTTAPAGTLISQSPVPGSTTPKGSTVDLVVSKGPATLVTVPNVVDKSRTAATKTLVAAGFKVTATNKASVATSGTVLTQTPAKGKAPKGSSVQIGVSTGVAPVLPSLLGTWKTSTGSTYVFHAGNRVQTPGGGQVRYRLSGTHLIILYAGRPSAGDIKWDSADRFRLTLTNYLGVVGKSITYTRVK